MPANTVCVHRPSKWGNPFKVVDHGRDRAIAKYRRWLTKGEGRQLPIDELRGKNLACFCRLDEACHADVLLELANSQQG
jgi:hypothetical protein